MVSEGWLSVAFFHQVDRLKPTRLLSNLTAMAQLGNLGSPSFDDDGFYTGPLPSQCTHGGHPPLIKQAQEEPFHTTGTGVYPPAMDAALAEVILASFPLCQSSKGVGLASGKEELGGDVAVTAKTDKDVETENDIDGQELTDMEWEGSSLGDDDAPVTGVKVEELKGDQIPVTRESERYNNRDLEVGEIQEEVPDGGQPRAMRAHYKGKSRPVHDGLGLCSIGRRAANDREVSPLAIRSQCILKSWRQGANPRQEGREIETPALELRLLKVLAEEVGDLDFSYLEEMASVGVRLGAGKEDIPRIPEVYEEEDSWSLPLPTVGKWEEEQVRGNYRSAEEHMEKVRGQIQKDIDQGHIVRTTLDEARARYGSDLKVASLTAVPKDTMRDATHGVEVNRQIRAVNRMRFPLFDDLEAVRQFLDEAELWPLTLRGLIA